MLTSTPRDTLRLTPAIGEQPAFIKDTHSGFSVAVPGNPELAPTRQNDGLPRHELHVVEEGVAGLALLYQLDEVPGTLEAGPLALTLAMAVARARAANPQEASVRLVPAPLLRAWGEVEGAAAALYETHHGIEKLLVLRRRAQVVYLYQCFSASHPLLEKLYGVAVDSGIYWGAPEELNERAAPLVFPVEGVLMKPGLSLALTDAGSELAARIAKLGFSEAERDALWERIDNLLAGAEPHPQPIAPTERAVLQQYLTDALSNPAMRDLLDEAITRLRTAFDLRALLVVLIQEMNGASG